MIPELFSIGPFTVYSYGLMLGIAFIVAGYILNIEYARRGLGENLATEITVISIFFGVVGSKLFHLFSYWDEFLADPGGMIFNPGGLVFHGGLILTVIVIYLYVQKKKISFWYLTDATAPSLAIAYGIGRIGCHLSGDGDYGIPTDLPWGTNYENGIVKPSHMFMNSDIAKSFPGGIVPDNTPLHPTPIYEFLGALALFYLLWHLRKKNLIDGQLFMLYLVLAGFSRFLVEFIRLNPSLAFGLTEAQLVALGMVVAGIAGWIYFSKRSPEQNFKVTPVHQKKKKN